MSTEGAIHIQEKLDAVGEHWRPHVIAELNGQEVKVVKLLGEFPWHHHDDIDELFFAWRGTFRMEFRDRSVIVGPGQCLVVPRGVEHRPVAQHEAEILLLNLRVFGTPVTWWMNASPLRAPFTFSPCDGRRKLDAEV